MNRISCAAFALVGLALALGLAGCGSDGTAEAGPSATTTGTSLSLSSSSPEHAESSPAPQGTSAADAFTAYAEGGRPEVPWAGIVSYRIGGEQVARFGPDLADRRETWDGCPRKSVMYEGRDCPVSPLSTIARLSRDGGEVVYETQAPSTVGCNRYSVGPEAATTIWIRPSEERRDCFSDFAVAVSLDKAGRVVSVDLALSGP